MAKEQVAGQESLGEAMNKTELFFEENGRKIGYIFLALLILAALIFGYRSLIVLPRAEKAAEMIAEAQYRFEATTPDFELALVGDENGAGFLDVIEKYGSTPSGNLAKHYAGICYLRQGDLENAAKYLAMYSTVKGVPGALVNAQNYGLQGDVAVEQGNYAAAVKFYEKAVAAADNNLTAPQYLRKAGLAEQAQGNTERAAEFYQRLLTSYPASMEAREDEKLLGSVLQKIRHSSMATRNHNLSKFDSPLPSAADMRFGIVVAEWNREVTEALLEGAVRTLRNAGCPDMNIQIKYVPGTFELALGAQFFAEYTDVDAVIALGCVIQGDTRHFDFICQGVTQGITQLQIQWNMPIAFGVLTVNDMQQALDRCGGRLGNKGDEAAATAINMVKLQIDMEAASPDHEPDRRNIN